MRRTRIESSSKHSRRTRVEFNRRKSLRLEDFNGFRKTKIMFLTIGILCLFIISGIYAYVNDYQLLENIFYLTGFNNDIKVSSLDNVFSLGQDLNLSVVAKNTGDTKSFMYVDLFIPYSLDSDNNKINFVEFSINDNWTLIHNGTFYDEENNVNYNYYSFEYDEIVNGRSSTDNLIKTSTFNSKFDLSANYGLENFKVYSHVYAEEVEEGMTIADISKTDTYQALNLGDFSIDISTANIGDDVVYSVNDTTYWKGTSSTSTSDYTYWKLLDIDDSYAYIIYSDKFNANNVPTSVINSLFANKKISIYNNMFYQTDGSASTLAETLKDSNYFGFLVNDILKGKEGKFISATPEVEHLNNCCYITQNKNLTYSLIATDTYKVTETTLSNVVTDSKVLKLLYDDFDYFVASKTTSGMMAIRNGKLIDYTLASSTNIDTMGTLDIRPVLAIPKDQLSLNTSGKLIIDPLGYFEEGETTIAIYSSLFDGVTSGTSDGSTYSIIPDVLTSAAPIDDENDKLVESASKVLGLNKDVESIDIIPINESVTINQKLDYSDFTYVATYVDNNKEEISLDSDSVLINDAKEFVPTELGNIELNILVTVGSYNVDKVVTENVISSKLFSYVKLNADENDLEISITGVNLSSEELSSIDKLYIPSKYDGYTVVSIADLAFNGSKVKNVEIADGITSIGNYAFYKSSIESITFTNSIRTINSYAFEHSNLQNVIFNGTKEEYSTISIKSNNSVLNNIEVVYKNSLGE